MPRVTRAQLVEENCELSRMISAYQEAYWALRRGEKPRKLKSGEYTIEVLALNRAHGGLVLEGPSVMFAEKWTASESKSASPHVRQLVDKVRQLQFAAVCTETGS